MEPTQLQGVWIKAPHEVMDHNSCDVNTSSSVDLDEIISFGSNDAKSMALKLHAFYNMSEVLLKFKDICSSNLDTILQDAVVKIMSMIGQEYLEVTKTFICLGLGNSRSAQDLLNHIHTSSHGQHCDGEDKGIVNASVIVYKEDKPCDAEISHIEIINEIRVKCFTQSQNNTDDIFNASEFLSNDGCRLPSASTPKPTLQEQELVAHFENIELSPAPNIHPSTVYHNLDLNQMLPGKGNIQISENHMWHKTAAPSLIQQYSMPPCQTNAHVPTPVYLQMALNSWLPQYNISSPPVGQFSNESNRYQDFYNDAYLESRVASSESAFTYQQASNNIVGTPTSTVNEPISDFLQSVAMSFPAPQALQQNFIMKNDFSGNPNFIGNYCPPINNGVNYKSSTDGMMPCPSYQIENTVESVSPFAYLNGGLPFLSHSRVPLSPLLSAVSVMRGCEGTSSNSNSNILATSERVSVTATEELCQKNELLSGTSQSKESFTVDSLCLYAARDEETVSKMEGLDRPENILSNKNAAASILRKYSDEVLNKPDETSLPTKCADASAVAVCGTNSLVLSNELPNNNQPGQEKVSAVLYEQCEKYLSLSLNMSLPNHFSVASTNELEIDKLFCSYSVHKFTKDWQNTSFGEALSNIDTHTSMTENASISIQAVPDICSLSCPVSEVKEQLESSIPTYLSFSQLASDNYSTSYSHLSNSGNEKINTAIKQLENLNSSRILHSDKRNSSIFEKCVKLHHCQNCCKPNQCCDAIVCYYANYMRYCCLSCSKKRHSNCNNCRTCYSYNHCCHCCTGTLTCHVPVQTMCCLAPHKYMNMMHSCRRLNSAYADAGATPHPCSHRCCYRRPDSCAEKKSTKCVNLKNVSHSEMCFNLRRACPAIFKLCHVGPTNCCCKIGSESTKEDTPVRNVMVSDSFKINCSVRENIVIEPHWDCQTSPIVRKIGKSSKPVNKVKNTCRYKKKRVKILTSPRKPSNVKLSPQKCVLSNIVLDDTEWESFDKTSKTPKIKRHIQDTVAGRNSRDSRFSREYSQLENSRTVPFQQQVYRLDFTQHSCASTVSNIYDNMKQQFNCKCVMNVEHESSSVGALRLPVVNNEKFCATKLDPVNLASLKQNEPIICTRAADFTKKTELHAIRNKNELNGTNSIQSSPASFLNKIEAHDKQFIGVKRLISLFENVPQMDINRYSLSFTSKK